MSRIEKHTSAQYIGKENKAVVKIGDEVKAGRVIATSSSGRTKVYSTTNGTVKRITSSSILLEYEIEVIDVKDKVEYNSTSNDTETPSQNTFDQTEDNIKETEVKAQNIENIEEVHEQKNSSIKKIVSKFFIDKKHYTSTSSNSRFNVDALDGFRTLAIMSVILYHLDFQWFKGGLIGVTIFFVLSGYLITGILKNEIESSGKIKLGRFWLHRVRRLFPAIACVIIIVALICIAFNHILLTKMRPDIIPSLAWLQNWWYILRGMTYFEQIGDPSPLIHFWSLAIEEQFYIIWPLILIALYKIGANNKFIRRICLVLAVLSAMEMFLMYDPLADPTRVYYGTDTRAFSLLIGAFLAYIWPWQKFKTYEIALNEKKIQIINIISAAALALLFIFMIFIEGTSPWMYYGILFISSILAAIIILSLVVPGTWLSKIFAFQPLVWIGKRSYGMYLWHFPLILILKPINGDITDVWWFAIMIISLTIILSSLQYTLVENPIRRGALNKYLNKLKSKKFKLRIKDCLVPAFTCLFIGVTIVGVCVAPDETLVPEEEIESTNAEPTHAIYVSGTYEPLLIADSITGAIKLENFFPNSLNDSAVGRWTYQAVSVLQEYATKGVLGKNVVMSCFSNHIISDGDLDKMLEIVGADRHLFLVTPYLVHEACGINNQMLNEFQSQHPDNVHIVDWFAAVSVNLDVFLYKDHVHLNEEGKALYLNTLANAINPYLPENSQCNISTIATNLKK